MTNARAALAIAFLASVAILLISWTSYFNSLNDIAYDFAMRLAGSTPPSGTVVIVAIDDASLERLGRWPWPRDLLGRLLESTEKGSPRAVGIDLLLDDRTDPELDRRFEEVVNRSRNLVLATRIDVIDQETRWRKPAVRLANPNVRLGHVHADPDLDGIHRRILTAKFAAGEVYSAFALECLRAPGARPTEVIRPRLINVRFAGDRRTFEHIPAWELLEGRRSPSALRDRIVLIGATAEGLGDQWMTPFSASGAAMSGIEIHANAVETVRSGTEISETPEALQLLLLVGLLMALWGIDRRYEGRRFYVGTLVGMVAVIAASWILMKWGHHWLPFPTFVAAIIFAVPALEAAKIARVNRNLDEKIARLSTWGEAPRPVPGVDIREEIQRRVSSESDREGWLDVLDAHEQEALAWKRREELLDETQVHDARWKLGAIDHFNEKLLRFLSFNAAILGGIEDVIIVADPAMRVVYQNPACRRLRNYQHSPSRCPEYCAGLLDGRSFWNEFATVVSTGESRTIERVRSSEGRVTYNVTISAIGRSGLVISFHDVTAQQELDRAKNDMISLVSHELRTPLTSIRGYSEMLTKYDLVHEKGKPFLDTIVQESQRLSQLIQSFLDVAYIESGRQKLNATEFEIRRMFEDIAGVLGPIAQAKAIRLELEPAATVVRADRMLLHQAVSNLVTNAIKYSPEGTKVRLAASNGAGKVTFEVQDEGCGISAEDIPRLFQKFYRRDNPETQNQSGFGLGLSFVKEVAEKHGGGVGVTSDPGRGSTFSIWVPN